ncbi:MAG: MarR family transcriptional regulator [Lachnospiraceae bacterium]|nr:MarR family transcriptional regulator [Lachnospiraceae bacterium]
MSVDYQELAKEYLQVKSGRIQLQLGRAIMGLTEGGIYVLHVLHKMGGKAYPKDIVNEIGISSARVAKVLNGLESDGMIVRSRDPEDGRQTIITMTKKGIKKAEYNEQTSYKRLAQVLSMLGEKDAREYVRIEKKLSACVAENAAECLRRHEKEI